MTTLTPPRPDSGTRDNGSRPTRRSRRAAARADRGRARASRPRLPNGVVSFVGAITAILTAGLVALLLVNNALAAGSFEQAAMKAEQTALFEHEQALRQQVLELSSPTNLRIEAAELGLVAAATTVYLDVQTGRIHGIPRPATGGTLADGYDPTTGLPLPELGAETDLGTAQTPPATDPATAVPSSPEGAMTQPGATPAGSDSAEPESVGSGDGAADPLADQGSAGAPAAGGQGDGAELGGTTARDRAILTGVDQ